MVGLITKRGHVSCSRLAIVLLLLLLPPAATTASEGEGDKTDENAQLLEKARNALKEKDYGHARRLAERALGKDPNNAEAHLLAARAALMESDVWKILPLEVSEDHLDRALELAPDLPGVHGLLGYLETLKVKRLRKAGSQAAHNARLRAVHHYEKELALSPQDLPSLQGLAVTLAELEENDRAIRAHEAWIQAAPQQTGAYLSLEQLHIRANRLDDAVALLEGMPPDPPEMIRIVGFDLGLKLYRRCDKDRMARVVKAVRDRGVDTWHPHLLDGLEQMLHGRISGAKESLVRFTENKPPWQAAVTLIELLDEFPREECHGITPVEFSRPKAVRKVKPKYPWRARGSDLEGKLKALVFIARDGKPTVLISIPPAPNVGFEPAARDAIESSVFEPARFRGEQVDWFLIYRVHFDLER